MNKRQLMNYIFLGLSEASKPQILLQYVQTESFDLEKPVL